MRNNVRKESLMKLACILPLFAAAIVNRVVAPAQAAPPAPASAPASIAAALNGAQDLGRATGKPVDVSVVLPYRHAADLPYLIRAQSTSGSKYYRRFLTAAQFRSYFSPTLATYTAALLALKKAGFAVETVANRTVLHATGTSADAERYFHTTIDMVRQPDGRLGHANVATATVPAELTGARIVGLSSIVTAQTALRQSRATRRPANSYGGPLFGPDGGFGPLGIAKAEDFPVEHKYRGGSSNVADLIDGVVADRERPRFPLTAAAGRIGLTVSWRCSMPSGFWQSRPMHRCSRIKFRCLPTEP
jgi:hypothetical protein